MTLTGQGHVPNKLGCKTELALLCPVAGFVSLIKRTYGVCKKSRKHLWYSFLDIQESGSVFLLHPVHEFFVCSIKCVFDRSLADVKLY